MTPQHHIIKETSETLSRLLQDEFKRNGYKRVHIVEHAEARRHQGKLPAVSLYLYQMSLDPEGTDSTPHSELAEVPQDDGTIKEYSAGAGCGCASTTSSRRGRRRPRTSSSCSASSSAP
ncbi:MAG: hypothetical protein R2939_18920 [Kofleriaceae bacterium]